MCDRLVSEGVRVVGLDNFDPYYARAVKERNLAWARGQGNFVFVEGDVRDGELLEKMMRKARVGTVVHLAAKAGVRASVEDPAGFESVNVGGTMTVLEAMRRTGAKRLAFGSSSSVYGNNKKVPFAEQDRVDEPISPYAATKKAGELLCHTYHHLYKMDIVCLRFFTVYGPRQRPDLAIHKFVRLLEAGEAVEMYGDGSMARDFTYIDDIVDGVMAALRECRGWNLFNLGESRPYRVEDLIRMLERVMKVKAVVERKPVPPGDVKQTYADILRATTKLGYRPKVRLEDGLARFVAWYRAQEEVRTEKQE